MENIGYSLIDAGNVEIMRWGDTFAKALRLPTSVCLPSGTVIYSRSEGDVGEGCRIVPRVLTYADPESVIYDPAAGWVVVTSSLIADLTAYLGRIRWEREQAGIAAAGLPIKTDDRSKLMIMGARVMAEADPTFVTRWILPDHSTVELGAAQVIEIALAVAAYVNEGFVKSASVLDRIVAGTIVSRAEVRAAFLA